MNAEQAKLLLRACRPNGRDAADPEMARALEQVKRDPQLAAWFAREQAHDAIVAGRLAAIAPPAGLRAAIFAGAAERGRIRPAGISWWRPVVFAAAVAVAVLLSFAVARWQPLVRGATFEEFAVKVVANGFLLQKHSDSVADLKAWLTEKRGPIPADLPAEFARLRALGCRTLEFRGSEVSLVCFERDGKEFHVFVARAGDRPTESVEAGPRFLQRGKLVAAAWSNPSAHYVVVSDATVEVLKRLL